MWLPWDIAAISAGVLAVVLVLTRRVVTADRRGRGWWLAAHEICLMLGLYALWQWVHERTITRTEGAIRHSTWVVNVQNRLHFPTELSVQHAVLPHPWLVQFLNGYYAIAHVPAMGILLVWAFFRHRTRYTWIRNTLALTTAGCLALQTIPVAPPRFRPDLGYVDTALRYSQSVYGRGGSGISNQLSAMPSIHVGWAVLVAVAVILASRSRWRWLVLLHPVLTVVAVVATANHWWLDGIVAVAILLIAGVLAATPGRWRQTRALKRVMVSSMPSTNSASTASAASSNTTSSSACSALPGRRST